MNVVITCKAHIALDKRYISALGIIVINQIPYFTFYFSSSVIILPSIPLERKTDVIFLVDSSTNVNYAIRNLFKRLTSQRLFDHNRWLVKGWLTFINRLLQF